MISFLFKTQTFNDAEALYLNKQFSHLFFILGGNSLESLTSM